MVRETRHLWVGNLPDNIREDRIREHFKRYGRVQNVKLLGRTESGSTVANASGGTNSGVCATVAFMDIKSASKAHNAEHVLDERTLTTEYYEPAAIPSAAGAPSAGSSPAGSGYSGSSSSVNSTPAPSSVSRYHLSGGEESTGSACPLAATAAAPANWRGTNDSASEYCRRGNTPATYSRYQRNNSNAPYSTPPSNVERTTPHHRWYATGDRGGGGGGGATGGESTPSTPGGGTEGGRRRRPSGSGSSRSESSSPEPSDTSRASTPQAPPPSLTHHANLRAPSTPSHHHQWSSTASGRPLAICVRNLPTRSTDSSLKDGLYHEYKKHGKVVWVKVVGQNADRYAVVRFKKPSDVEKALEVSQDKLFFGCKISVAPHQSCDEDADSAKPYETDIDEYHPKATRTLFIGNLEKDVSQQQLREKFKHFGRIIEIDIKKGSGGGAGYAFCQYASISSVVEAIRAMDGEYVGGSRVKLGFGKPVATTCVWVDGLTEHTEKQVLGAISRCGAATSVCVDRAAGAALVHFEQAAAAGAAVRELRRVAAAAAAAAGAGAAPPEPDHPRLCVDYASRECQEAFYEQLEKHGGGGGSLNGVDRLSGDVAAARYPTAPRHEQLRYEGCASRSRASSYSRASSRTPRYPALDPYEGVDYTAERRYRVYEELGSSPQAEDTPFEDRLQSVVVSPHRARRHRRDSSPEDRKHSKERHRSVGGSSVVGCVGAVRRSRSGSRGGERHAGRRRHRRRRDGSGSRGSRAGTPLRDEPDALPTEPRRPPRERPPLPMSLPLPKFAVQLLRQAPQTPRPAPAPALAPDSPPRPPSVSSSSGGSAPHSPSLEERIRSLDEKYERWSGGSRVPPPDPPRPKHRLLDVDINEVKPSEVVRSLLAKRSVFDEDSERLEGAVRAPSPVGSPRARMAPLTPRVLRYPFPAHPAPSALAGVAPAHPTTDAEPDVSERSADPRINRVAPLDRCAKFDEIDFRLESRVRPRTPSTDRSQPDSIDRRSPRTEQATETEPRTLNERRRRDSLYSSNKTCPEARVEPEAGTPRLDVVEFDYRTRDKSKTLISERRQSIGRSQESTVEKSVPCKTLTSERRQSLGRSQESNAEKSVPCKTLTSERRQSIGKSQELIIEKPVPSSSVHKEGFSFNEDKTSETILNRNAHDNNAPDLAVTFLKRIGNMHEFIKSESFVDKRTKSIDEYSVKSELPAHIDEEIKSTLNFEIKLEELGSQSKIENETVKEILSNHVKKEVEMDAQTTHVNTLVKLNKEIVEINQDLKSSDKNGKERFNQNVILNALHNTKLEKENIEHEKCFEKDVSIATHFFGEKKTLENDKTVEDRNKNEKSRHSKDHRHEKEKHENERDKVKSTKHDRILDKDKKAKEDHGSDKGHAEKIEKNKDGEKFHKERCDLEKSKHEDKSARHDHHRREKLDKRKESTDGDGKVKKEEKSKHDKKKDTSDSKRDTKKDGESSKSRKTSRDESSRDICRKDSTDSSTSRASHDSAKLKDIDINEIKEESKPKVKHYLEINCKSEIDKNSSPKNLDPPKLDPNTKIKSEIKEEKDVSEQQTKVKNENNSDHVVKVKDIEKPRHYSLDSPSVESKRKERLNSCSSLPSHIGHKRRMSSQDSIDSLNEDIKKLRNESKSTDRKESKDSRSNERHKTTKFNKGHFAKLIESKTKDDNKNQVKPPDDTFELKDNDKDVKPCSTIALYDKQKSKYNNSTEKSPHPSITDEKSPPHLESQSDGLHNDIDFLATLELRSSEEDERQKALRKEMKEKKRIQQLQQIHELQMQQDALQQAELLNKNKDDKKAKSTDEKRKEAARDKRLSIDRKSRDEKLDNSKRKNRKHVQSSDTSDSDEPKKHSIFDIIDDGPTYISMYDKVKARSCKNMQKQEEEKRQEKIKAKFSQLKQSRAKREEKKRSSWDEDSDSEHDRKKGQKTSMDSSTDDDTMYDKKEEKHGSSPDYKLNEYFNVPTNEEELRNKLSRKNSRSRIISDTSDDDASKRGICKSPNFINEHKRELALISVPSFNKSRDDASHIKELCEDKTKKNSLLNLFGKSDSDDSKLKSSLETDNEYKPMFSKSAPQDFSSESESAMCNRNVTEIRKKHKKKQKKHKSSVSDGENKTENDTGGNDGEMKPKISEKVRRHSNKKEKRKDKIRDSVDADDNNREERNKSKRDKKLMLNSFDGGPDSIFKKDGKMEDIFGPLSDDSDRDTRVPQIGKMEFQSQDYIPPLIVNEHNSGDESKFKDKEELKRRKERRRKERRYLTKDDENSLDVDAVSKAIEARLFAESITDDDNRSGIEALPEYMKKIEQNELKRVDDTSLTELQTYKSDKHSDKIKKDCREKRKKKKRNREDRQSRKDHHHFYHHDRTGKTEPVDPSGVEISSKEMLLDIPLPSDTPVSNVIEKSDENKSVTESPSLPRLTDSPPAEVQPQTETQSEKKSPCLGSDVSMDIDYPETKQIEVDNIPMPPPIESIDISEVPLPEDPPTEPLTNRETFVSTFKDDIGNSESAVRSISNLPTETEKQSDKLESPPPCKTDKKLEEKPRAIISQEETEDAVAALLGESFGGKVDFTDYEQVENSSSHQTEIESATIGRENILEEDAEEMRRAVQNLNASELEMKPDTPVSDNDLLLIDTDTEEADETPQDAIERLPVNIIATNQSIAVSTEQPKPAEISNIVIAKPKTSVVQVIASEANESVLKVNDQELKQPHTQRENVQVITSTATPVITSWTLTNNKIDPHNIVNIQTSPVLHRDKTENKHTHITANIVQIKSPNQIATGSNTLRPIINPSRVGAPYQVINQIIRPQSPNMQPPTIKIPEPHILYQKPSGIVISPRMQSNDPRLQSPKPTSQGESMTSPRLSNMAILSTSPQNLNSVGLPSPNTLQQRSPGQVTVVRMQQPPLSPIQAMHLPHGARTMVSPNIPNSVLVQTQGAPIHFNRLPVTPVLAPISKQLAVSNVVHQNKTIAVTVSPSMQQKPGAGEVRKSEHRPGVDSNTETAKIMLSPTSMPPSTNPTVMAQNRLIMQHAVHVSNVNSTLHLGNKVLLNNLSHLNDKRDNQTQKSEPLSHIPFGTTPIIHVAGVNHSSASFIQSGSKPVILQEANAVRSQGSNVIHTLNSQRLLTTAPITNVLQIDANKAPPSVLSMATIRPPTVLTKLDTSKSVVGTTTCLTNVVMTPILLKTSSNPGTIILNSKNDKDITENHTSPSPNHLSRNDTDNKMGEKHENKSPSFLYDTKEKSKCFKSSTPLESINKCETDFEELLKDTTNEIKVTNDPDKKLEVNVGKKVTLMTVPNRDRKLSCDGKKDNFDKVNKVSEQPVLEMAFLKSDEELNKTKNSQINKENRENFMGAEKIIEDLSETKLSIELSKTEIANKDSSITKICSEDEKEIRKSSENQKENIFALESNESESNDNALKNLDENDSWSAKDVNIDSVIKKVDSLCSDSNEATEKKDDNIENDAPNSDSSQSDTRSNRLTSNPEPNTAEVFKPTEMIKEILMETSGPEDESGPLKAAPSGKRGGRSGRGRKAEKLDRVQTRQISKPARGGTATKRGRGRAKVDKKVKTVINSNINNMPGDVYDFHEDSGDETTSPNKAEARPRLILTIKSPILGHNNSCPTSTLSITPKEHGKIPEKNDKEEKPEDFVSPSLNTRKSRRLQEKDVQKTTTDDSADEFGKGPKSGKRRATRQAGTKANQATGNDSRKSPRGVKRGRDRSLSDASIDSGDEKIIRRDETTREAKAPRLSEPTQIVKNDCEPPVTSVPVQRPPAQPVIQPTVVQSVVTPTSVVQSVPQPTVVQPVITHPTPIMKPPKKMISEISAKLAGAFEAAVVSSVRMPIPCVAQQPAIQPIQRAQVAEAVAEKAPSREPLEEFRAEARRLVDNVPGSMMPVGATEATDARVQSPALPHRPPSSHRTADRATPILIRGGDGEGALVAGGAGVGAAGPGAGVGANAGAVAGAGAGASRFRGAYAGPASLPRGAHHPHHHPHVKQVAVVGPHHYAGSAPRVTLTSVPAVSPQGQLGLSTDLVRSPPPAHQQTSPVASGDGMYPHFSHQHYQVYQQHFRATQHENRASPSPYTRSLEAEGCEAPAPPLELRRPASARVPRPAHSPAPSDRHIMYAVGCGRSPPPAHGTSRLPGALPPLAAPGPPHASQVPREADSLQMLLRRYPVMWQGLLALKNDSAAVQMHFVGGNHAVAGDTLPRLADGSAPLLRIAQRMRLEPAQLDQVHRKMKMETEHCILLALPCGRDHMDVLQQSTNLTHGFITYLQRKQAAGIVNIAPPGHQQALFTVHIFPSCDFANENLNRIAPDLMHRVADIAHLLIVIATV